MFLRRGVKPPRPSHLPPRDPVNSDVTADNEITTPPHTHACCGIDQSGGTTTMQSGNILQIPFRRTHSLHLSPAIKSYISTKYDQHPDTFARDLEIIDQLRKDAVASVEAHSSGVRKIQAYAAQLVWMGGKFPVDVSVARWDERQGTAC